MESKADLEGIASELVQDDAGHFQLLENQIFRKTYVAAKKEIDEWLRAHSYTKAPKVAQEEGPPVDKDENEFLTQLKLSAGQNQSQESQQPGSNPRDQGQSQQQAELSFNADTISMTQYRHRQSVKALTREFLKKLKNPDLNLDGSLKPASTRKNTNHARNLASLHYDQNDPFAVAKA